MTLLEWVKDALKNGPELYRTEVITTNDKGVVIKRDTTRLKEISLGIISSNDTAEWYRICKLNCPVGTIIEPYNEDEWTEIYNDALALVRNSLTKSLLTERASKSAQTLLKILEKRDKAHWSDEKKVEVMNNEDNKISINIVGA